MQNRVPVVFLKFKLLFACLALCLCVNAGLFAQSKKFVQKIQWQPDENAFGYRVEVRSKTADSKPKVIETEDSFVELSLTPGKYEYRVTAVDFLGREAVSSDWTEFEIIKALLPEIVQTENKVVAPEAEEGKLSISVDVASITEESKVELVNSKTEEVVSGELKVEPDEKGVKASKAEFPAVEPGEWTLRVTNPSGLSSDSQPVAIISKESR